MMYSYLNPKLEDDFIFFIINIMIENSVYDFSKSYFIIILIL